MADQPDQPFRLAPVSERPEFSCPDCFSSLTENFQHDVSTGRHFDCIKCQRTMIPESYTRRESETIALGSTEGKYSKAGTSFVAVSSNRRVVTAGSRSSSYLPKSRSFTRDPHDTSFGYQREDLPSLAGQEDRDFVELLNRGVMTRLVTSGEDED